MVTLMVTPGTVPQWVQGKPQELRKQGIDQGAGLNGQLFVKKKQKTSSEKFSWQNQT